MKMKTSALIENALRQQIPPLHLVMRDEWVAAIDLKTCALQQARAAAEAARVFERDGLPARLVKGQRALASFLCERAGIILKPASKLDAIDGYLKKATQRRATVQRRFVRVLRKRHAANPANPCR